MGKITAGPLKNLGDVIVKLLPKDTYIISLEVLLPDNVDLQNIISYVCFPKNGPVDKSIYDSFIDNYVQQGEELRSLYFLKYRDCFKYRGVKNKFQDFQSNSQFIDKTDFNIFSRDPFSKSSIKENKLKELRAEKNISAFWNAWVKEIGLSLKLSTYSTLWSYIYIQDNKFLSSIYIIFSKPIEDKDHLLSVINKKLQDFLFQQTLDIFKNDVVDQATRAAISQVMARNTSHNIGAHVMNKLIGKLRDLVLLKDTGQNLNYQSNLTLQDIHSKIITDLSENNKWYKEAGQNWSADSALEFQNFARQNEILLDQISIFNNYVKCRMDYLADISFGTPLMQTNKYAYGELFTELDKVRLLLEHISGLDKFPFKILFQRNGKPFKTSANPLGEEDLLVAIPNDILGTQAFYNILENIIRNTAKHTNKEKLGDKPAVFTINFIDDIEKTEEYKHAINRDEINNVLTEFIAVEVYDNISVEGEGRDLTKEEKTEYRGKMKTDLDRFISKIDALVFNQNSKLNDDILQKDNKIRSYSLGLVEMDASAAYLRKRPVEYINHKSYDIHYDESWSRPTEVNEGNEKLRGTNCRHFLKAFKKTTTIYDNGTEKTEHYLGYRFFLHRPAVVLVVTELLEEASETNKRKKEELRKEGIWVISPNEFENELKAGKVYPHEFVVHTGLQEKLTEVEINNKKENVLLLQYYKTSRPLRILELEESDLIGLFIEKEETAEIECNDEKISVKKTIVNVWEEFCWKKWQEEHLKLEYESNGMPKKDNKASDFYDHKLPSDITLIESEYFYADALSSNAQKKLPLLNGKIADYYASVLKVYPTIKLQVGESVCSRILVIDERIQENGRKIHHDNIPISFLYKMTGIIVPEYSQVNLSANTMTPTLGKRIKVIIRKYAQVCNSNKIRNKEVDKLNSKFDFILIHYSILERMFNSDKKEITMFLKDLGTNNNVIITSGRGEPDGLPREVRFINLSSVIHALVETRSKYFINYIMHQSRNSSKQKK